MDRGAKIILASAVLTAGIAAALLFRNPTTRVGSSEPRRQDALVLRQNVGPDGSDASITGRPTVRIEAKSREGETSAESDAMPAILTPMDPGEPPPQLARSYPRAQAAAPPYSPDRFISTWDRRRRAPGRARTHKIVDGDTLAALAEKYLGNPNRHLEIYEANRDRLPAPELLPIGVELTIPPRRPVATSRPKDGSQLVPVPRSLLRRHAPANQGA
jgi:nucleoid-associated protein YgaU